MARSIGGQGGGPLQQVKQPFHAPFHFDSRRTRIDWRLLHSIDISQVQAKTDLDALDRVVDVVAYGDMEGEDIRNLSEVNFLKVFRLAQMMVEYLLHVQEALRSEKEHYEHQAGQAAMHAEALRLKCKEQKELLGLAKRELKQCKKSLKTMEILAEMGKENKNQNKEPPPPPPPPPPQVVYLDSPETLAHVQQLQAEIDRMVEQRRQMQSTIAALTRQLEEFEDGGDLADMGGRDHGSPGMGRYSQGSQGPGVGSPAPQTAVMPGGIGEEEVEMMVERAREEARRASEQHENELRSRNTDLYKQIEERDKQISALAKQLRDIKEQSKSHAASEDEPRASATGTGSLSAQLHLERRLRNTESDLQTTREELRRVQEEKDAMQIDLVDLMDDLEKTQRKLTEAEGRQPGGISDTMDDDDAANKWDEERRKLQELLAESDRQLADARQEVEAAREGGADMRRVRLANERLQEELGNLEAERKDLRDEVAKLRRVAQRAAASDAQQDDDAEFRVQELSAQIASLQAERRQLLLDLDVARDAADRLRDNLDNSEQEARRLRGLLDQAGVQHEAELQQAAAEGRRVKLQAEQLERSGVSPQVRPPVSGSPRPSPTVIGSGRPPSGLSPPTSSQQQAAVEPLEQAGGTAAEFEIEEMSDWDPDSPMQSLAAPAPVRTRVIGGGATVGTGEKGKQLQGSHQRSSSADAVQTAKPTPAPIAARRASTSGWSAGPLEVQLAAPQEVTRDSIQSLNPNDFAPTPTQPFGGNITGNDPAQNSEPEGAASEPEMEELREFEPSEATESEPSSPNAAYAPSPTSTTDRQFLGLPPKPKPKPSSLGPNGGSSVQVAGTSRTPHLLGPHEDGTDREGADVLEAIEMRLLFDQPVRDDYASDPDTWQEYMTRFSDIYRFSTLDSSLTGRLSSELLSRASLEEARETHLGELQREMEHAMRSLGVDPSQEYMSDEQFSYAMDEIDRRRVEMDKACNDDQFDHTRFMRDTIRHHLQVVARKGKRQASQPDSEVQSEGQESVNAFDKDDSEDEDARTLGKFGRTGATKAQQDDNSQADEEPDSPEQSLPPKSNSRPDSPDPKNKGGASELEILSSFDASAEQSPTSEVAAGSEKPRDRGPVWQRSHDDPFDSSMESTGGAWGGGLERPQTFRKQPQAYDMTHSFDDDDFEDDDDLSIEELPY